MSLDIFNFDRSWREACTVNKGCRHDAEDMIQSHYLGKWPGVCVLILVMKLQGVAVGTCVYAMPPREAAKRYGGETWELARLWIEDKVPRNGETWFIAQSIRYIKKHFPTVEVLVSYADPSAGHAGTIYKAANWIADGRTDEDRKSPRVDYACAFTGKKYSRKSHAPENTILNRIPRVSKHRFIYRLSR